MFEYLVLSGGAVRTTVEGVSLRVVFETSSELSVLWFLSCELVDLLAPCLYNTHTSMGRGLFTGAWTTCQWLLPFKKMISWVNNEKVSGRM